MTDERAETNGALAMSDDEITEAILDAEIDAELLKRALDIEERAFGRHHPDVARTLINHALLCRAQGRISDAVVHHRRAAEVVEFNLSRNLVAGSERQKLAYLSRFSWTTDLAISLHQQSAPGDQQAFASALTALLRHKGRGLDAMTDAIAQLRGRASERDQALFAQLADARSQLAALLFRGYSRGNAESYRSLAEKLEKQMEQLEAELGSRSADLQAQLQPVTLAAAQALLPPDAALVEFAFYRPIDPLLREPAAPRYAVYALTARGEQYWADLGEARAIDRAVYEWRQALSNPRRDDHKQLARALDGEVMQLIRSLLGETRQLLIAPDGALNLAPFAALVDEDGRYLAERYSISYLTSGRDLLRLRNRAPHQQPPLIVADPDFGERPDCGAKPAINAAQSGNTGVKFEPASSSQPRPNCVIPPPGYAAPLPGTAAEAEEIKKLLPQATVLTRKLATETALKQASAPSLLHIATHGFFPEDAAPGTSLTLGRRLLLQHAPVGAPVTPIAQLASPALHSGLVMAGANLRRSGEDDGILTALEAAGLNLRGTRLVALSACGTGLGAVKTGDGVYGLRRALVLAGAETQVISLWAVSDQGTSELMPGYYQALQAGQGRGEALRQAQLQMLANPRRQHPYFWAGFIVSGEWANLDGQR